MISQELLDILACPKCKGEVTLTEKKDGLGLRELPATVRNP